MLYHSLFMSHIRYCILSWYFENKTLIDKLQRLCNKFIRIIFNLFHRKNVSHSMSEHNLITMKHMYKAEIGILMFKYQKNLLPRTFDKIFIQKSFHMKTRTRSSSCYQFLPIYCYSITLVNTQIFATDIILILGYIRCVDFENDIHFC